MCDRWSSLYQKCLASNRLCVTRSNVEVSLLSSRSTGSCMRCACVARAPPVRFEALQICVAWLSPLRCLHFRATRRAQSSGFSRSRRRASMMPRCALREVLPVRYLAAARQKSSVCFTSMSGASCEEHRSPLRSQPACAGRLPYWHASHSSKPGSPGRIMHTGPSASGAASTATAAGATEAA